jgi:formylmethanofuran dehydrogenase subunit B
MQEGNITGCAGRFSFYVWDNILTEAKKKGLEIPEDFDALIQNIPSF